MMKNKTEIEKKVTEIVTTQLQEKEFTPACKLTEVGADEFDIIEIIMKIEDAFTLLIPDEDLEQLTTIQALVSYVETTITKKI